MHEVPLTQRSLLTFYDRQRLARQHEEILLVGLAVIHRHRLAGTENGHVNSELQKISRALEACSFELTEEAATLAVPPLRLARVDDEPALSFRYKAVLCPHELRLRNHQSGHCQMHSAAVDPTRRSGVCESRNTGAPKRSMGSSTLGA